MFNPEPIHDFTVEEIVLLRSIINNTWDSISGDLFRGDDGEPDYHLRYDREEMVELALDAGRWQYWADEQGEAIVHKLKQLGWMGPEFKEVIAQACPNEMYGY